MRMFVTHRLDNSKGRPEGPKGSRRRDTLGTILGRRLFGRVVCSITSFAARTPTPATAAPFAGGHVGTNQQIDRIEPSRHIAVRGSEIVTSIVIALLARFSLVSSSCSGILPRSAATTSSPPSATHGHHLIIVFVIVVKFRFDSPSAGLGGLFVACLLITAVPTATAAATAAATRYFVGILFVACIPTGAAPGAGRFRYCGLFATRRRRVANFLEFFFPIVPEALPLTSPSSTTTGTLRPTAARRVLLVCRIVWSTAGGRLTPRIARLTFA